MTRQLALDLRESPLKGFCEYCGNPVVASGLTELGSCDGAVNAAGETLCVKCCAWADVIDLMNTTPGLFGVSALYFSPGGYSGSLIGKVQNWPCTLSMPVTHVTAWTPGGFGSRRRTVYFNGPVGSWWSGAEFDGNAGNLLRYVRRLTKGRRR